MYAVGTVSLVWAPLLSVVSGLFLCVQEWLFCVPPSPHWEHWLWSHAGIAALKLQLLLVQQNADLTKAIQDLNMLLHRSWLELIRHPLYSEMYDLKMQHPSSLLFLKQNSASLLSKWFFLLLNKWSVFIYTVNLLQVVCWLISLSHLLQVSVICLPLLWYRALKNSLNSKSCLFIAL